MSLGDTVQGILDRGVADGDVVGAVAKVIGADGGDLLGSGRHTRRRQRRRHVE